MEDAYKTVKERVDKSLNEVATAGSVLTILADGWTGAAKPYLNVVLAGPTSKTTVDEFFVATLDASANYKTASQVVAWVAAEVRKQPEAVQAQVGHFVVDGGMGANRAFEEEVAKEFPKMHVSICVTHTVDLFFEDVLEDKSSRCMAGAADVNDVYDFSWAKVVYDRVDGITKFFTSHEKLTYFAREECRLAFIRKSRTRFGINFLQGHRLIQLSEGLKRVVVSPSWTNWVQHVKKADVRASAGDIRSRILDDNFWEELKTLDATLLPVYKFLRLSDSEGYSLARVYDDWMRVDDELKAAPTNTFLTEDRRSDLHCHWIRRLSYFHKPQHTVAYLLNPALKTEAADDYNKEKTGVVPPHILANAAALEKHNWIQSDITKFKAKEFSDNDAYANVFVTELQNILCNASSRPR